MGEGGGEGNGEGDGEGEGVGEGEGAVTTLQQDGVIHIVFFLHWFKYIFYSFIFSSARWGHHRPGRSC